MTVFEYYYNKVKNKYNDIITPITIDEFMQMYYSQNKTIKEFSDNITKAQFSSLQYAYQMKGHSGNNIATPLSSSINDENYMLKADIGNENYTSAEYFKRKPIYEAFDYSLINNGDIIYEAGSKVVTRHIAFVYESSQPSDYGNYVQTIEAAPEGVEYGFLDDERMVQFGVVLYRIHRVTATAIETARAFIKEQLGKPFSYDMLTTTTDINAPEWYCSELVFAAYYKAGYNICSNNSLVFDPQTMPCLPVDITKGILSEKISISAIKYLVLNISSFTNSFWWNQAYWSISIYNPNSKNITIEYNTKMCNRDDAKNWTGLKHIETTTIGANSQTTVKIYQNLAAGAITASYKLNGKRYITYGTDLYKVDLTLNTVENVIDL